MAVQPLKARDAMEVWSDNIASFLESCSNCGRCKAVCPYLKRHGNPAEIIKDASQSVFLCANCTACDMVCPESLRPSEALLTLKHNLIKNGEISEKTKGAIESSRAFALRGHRFPFVYYSNKEVAFWPGCSLSGTSPELVKECLRLLKRKYSDPGLVLDCCFDPAFQNGDIETVKEAAKRIKVRLAAHGIKKLIPGCTNCKKIFDIFMPEIEAEHILDAIPADKAVFKEGKVSPEIFLHHPCPSFRFNDLQQRVENFSASKPLPQKISRFFGDPVFTVKGTVKIPMCCGAGGLSHALSEELSEDFRDKVLKVSNDGVIVTYCMGCKNRFLKGGKRAYHILELFGGGKPLEKPVSSWKKWLNRFFLSLSVRDKGKKLLVSAMLFLAIILSLYLQRTGYLSIESILEFIKAYRVLAPLIFILLYAIGPSIFLPSLPMTIGAGFIWGPIWGVVFSITGATIGASVPFLLARYIMADTIKARFGYEKWKWLKQKVERHGWKAVAFARLLPILPFPVLNYLFGVTPIPFLHYVWSSFVFMLPACITYVVFGSSMEEVFLKGNLSALIVGILVISIFMLLPFVVKRLYDKFSNKDE